MLRSMTAYGRASINRSLGRFVVEIQSINRRFLEMNFNLSSEFSAFEIYLRRWVRARVFRGMITVRVSIHADDFLAVKVRPNIPYVQELCRAWKEVAELCGEGKRSVDLQLLSKDENIFLHEGIVLNEDLWVTPLQDVVNQALDSFIAAKLLEGKEIKEDILKRFEIIRRCMLDIEKYSEQEIPLYREKLTRRLEEALPLLANHEERILREIVVFADRIDIHEEIVRFRIHDGRFHELLESTDDTPIGKNLDFLLQELQREINTIGSKSGHNALISLVVEVKTELEKIREQVQNVE